MRSSGDLFRRPPLGEAATDGRINVGIVHLSHQRPLPSSLLGLLLGLSGKVLALGAVASQFAADRARATAEGLGDFLLIGALMPQLRYPITLFHGEMTGRRWDSVPKGYADYTSPIEPSHRCFQLPHLLSIPVAFELADRPSSSAQGSLPPSHVIIMADMLFVPARQMPSN